MFDVRSYPTSKDVDKELMLNFAIRSLRCSRSGVRQLRLKVWSPGSRTKLSISCSSPIDLLFASWKRS